MSGAALGEDCAAFRTDGLVLISADPITGATEHIGRLAMKVAFNDVLAAGGEPMLAMLTILAPTSGTPEEISDIVAEAEAEAAVLNVEIAGGHTEFTSAVNRYVVTVTAIGRAEKHLKSTYMKAGDTLLLTKDAGLEGTAILATDKRFAEALPLEERLLAVKLAEKTDVRTDAVLARENGARSMHDVTEGGVFGAVCEITESANLGAEIIVDNIPIREITKKICKIANADPYRMLSSGCLLIACDCPEKLLSAFEEAGEKITVIGKVTEKDCVAVYSDGRRENLTVTPDEICRLDGV